MSDDDKKATDGTADGTNILKHAGVSESDAWPLPRRDGPPAPVLKLFRQIAGAANGTSNAPPRMQVSTAFGVLTLEANGSCRRAHFRKTPPRIRNPVSYR